jgi:hypothetical protein
MKDELAAGSAKPKISRVEVYWHTVTYRTVALYVVAVFVLVMAGTYLFFPETFGGAARHVSEALTRQNAGNVALSLRQARFVNLDGKVQVKKVNSVQWVGADYQVTLDKGDLIQTGSDGVARVAFADGTTYLVKPDTLVTVEENLVAQDQATRVGVHISSGAVDLATGTWPVAGSKAEVSFENAVAALKENSRAAVRTDPFTKEHEITVANGSAELERGGEKVQIDQWQRVSFPTGGPISREQVLAPPELIEPVNLQPIIVPEPKKAVLKFEWKPVPTAKSYQLRISSTAMFTQVVAEKKANSTSAEITGLDSGDYFWSVKAIDAHNNASEWDNPFKFTLVSQSKAQDMLLEVDATELHGNVVEVIGRTEPGAALLVNGQPVADIQTDGHFRYFTEPMTRGSQTIVITGQNRRGGTAIKRVPIVIP